MDKVTKNYFLIIISVETHFISNGNGTVIRQWGNGTVTGQWKFDGL